MLYINARCRQILNILLSHTDYISVDYLTEELNVSRRTIYYDLCKINLMLEQNSLRVLDIVRDKGLLLGQEERSKIAELLADSDKKQVYVFSPAERVNVIICCIIYAREKIYMKQLIECCDVSRNTVFSDLKCVTDELAKYDFKLEYNVHTGYYIAGNTLRIRSLFLYCFNELSPLFLDGTIDFFPAQEYKEYYDKLKAIETTLNISYVGGTLTALAALLPIISKQKAIRLPETVRRDEITGTSIYAMIEDIFPDMPTEEQLYVTLYLLSSRLNTASW